MRDDDTTTDQRFLEPRRGRDASKEDRHAKRTITCGGALIGTAGGSAGIYPFHCGRWRCTKCGARKLRQTRERIRAGLALGPVMFITLTSPGRESPADSIEQLSRRWKAFLLRLTRHLGKIEYCACVELQRRGNPHLHVLVRGPLVSARWVAEAAAEVGFGRQSDVRRPSEDIVGYVTKAIGPGTSGDDLPTYLHRVRPSKGWSLPTPRRAKPAWHAWYIAFAGTRRAAASAESRGYRVVELVHGPPDQDHTTRPVRWVSLDVFAPR